MTYSLISSVLRKNRSNWHQWVIVQPAVEEQRFAILPKLSYIIAYPHNDKSQRLQITGNIHNNASCFFFLFVKDESVPYTFFVNETEITGNLKETLESQTLETEKVVEIVYQPQAVFKVRAVTRCTSTIPGEALINLNLCV